ncbi:hypothetical protein HK102_005428, partial [Quaeritorhiza haematococci]
ALPSLLPLLLILLSLLTTTTPVHANIEKIFLDGTPPHQKERYATPSPDSPSSIVIWNQTADAKKYKVPPPEKWPTLYAPYTILHNRLITAPSIFARARRENETETERKEREQRRKRDERQEAHYYWVEMEEGWRYEARVSYLATTPADFEVKEILVYFSPRTRSTVVEFETRVLRTAVRVTAVHTGVSAEKGEDAYVVPYNMVLEQLYLRVIPITFIPVGVLIIILCAMAHWIIIPWTYKFFVRIALDDDETRRGGHGGDGGSAGGKVKSG